MCERKKFLGSSTQNPEYQIFWYYNDGKTRIDIPVDLIRMVRREEIKFPLEGDVYLNYIKLPSGEFVANSKHGFDVLMKHGNEYIINNTYEAKYKQTIRVNKLDFSDSPFTRIGNVGNWECILIDSTNNKLVGSSGGHIKNGESHVGYIQIIPSYRGRGLCSKIMGMIFDKAHELNVEKVTLENSGGEYAGKCYVRASNPHFNFKCVDHKTPQADFLCHDMVFPRK